MCYSEAAKFCDSERGANDNVLRAGALPMATSGALGTGKRAKVDGENARENARSKAQEKVEDGDVRKERPSRQKRKDREAQNSEEKSRDGAQDETETPRTEADDCAYGEG